MNDLTNNLLERLLKVPEEDFDLAFEVFWAELKQNPLIIGSMEHLRTNNVRHSDQVVKERMRKVFEALVAAGQEKKDKSG